MKKRTVFGLPITPARHLAEVAGSSFCVSFATRQTLGKQLDQAIAAVGDDEILLVDNGAFSAWRSGVPMDVDGFARWAADILARCPQAVAVVPDVIDGDAAANDEMLIDFRGAVLELGLAVPGDLLRGGARAEAEGITLGELNVRANNALGVVVKRHLHRGARRHAASRAKGGHGHEQGKGDDGAEHLFVCRYGERRVRGKWGKMQGQEA